MPFHLITLLGLSEVVTGSILIANPNIIFRSTPVLLISKFTGLALSDASVAPGFNNAIAIAVLAVGAGGIRAGISSSRDAHASMVIMRMAWAAGILASLAFDSEGVGSAVHLLTGVNHVIFSAALLYAGGFSLKELLGLDDHKVGSSGGKGVNGRRKT